LVLVVQASQTSQGKAEMELVAEHQVWLASSMHRAAAAALLALIRHPTQTPTQWQESVVALVVVVAVLASEAPLVVVLEYPASVSTAA
jgi:hypothetical protein